MQNNRYNQSKVGRHDVPLHVSMPSSFSCDPKRFELQMHCPEFQLWLLTMICVFFVSIEYNDKKAQPAASGAASSSSSSDQPSPPRSIHSLGAYFRQESEWGDGSKKNLRKAILDTFRRTQEAISAEILALKKLTYSIISQLDPLYARSLFRDVHSEQFWIDWKRGEMKDPTSGLGDFSLGKDTLKMPVRSKANQYKHANWARVVRPGLTKVKKLQRAVLRRIRTQKARNPKAPREHRILALLRKKEKKMRRQLPSSKSLTGTNWTTSQDFNGYFSRHGRALQRRTATANHALIALMSTAGKVQASKQESFDTKGKSERRFGSASALGTGGAAQKCEEFMDRLVADETGESGVEEEYMAKNDKVFMWQVQRLFSQTHLARYFEAAHSCDFLQLVFKYKGIDMQELKRKKEEDAKSAEVQQAALDAQMAAFFGAPESPES